jgi:hypothetical protein
MALAADLDAGRRWTLAGLAAVLSFCVQAHAGLAVAGLAVAVVGIGAASPLPRSVWTRAAIVTAALWAIPLLHEVRVRPGNLETMVQFFLDPGQLHASWPRAVDVAGYMLSGPLLPSWQVLEGEVPPAESVAVPAMFWLATIAVTAIAIMRARRGDRREATIAGVAAAATAAVPVAAHGVVGAMSDYLLAWAPAVGAFDVAVVLAALAPLVAPAPDWRRWRAPLLATVLVAWAVIGGQRLIGKHADQARDTTMRALAADVQRYCRDRDVTRPVLGFDSAAWQELAGLVLQFDKAGVPIAVSDAGLYLVGPSYARTGHDAAELYVMPTSATIPGSIEGRTEWVATRGAFRVVRVR